jgi:hypothetical protein
MSTLLEGQLLHYGAYNQQAEVKEQEFVLKKGQRKLASTRKTHLSSFNTIREGHGNPSSRDVEGEETNSDAFSSLGYTSVKWIRQRAINKQHGSGKSRLRVSIETSP